MIKKVISSNTRTKHLAVQGKDEGEGGEEKWRKVSRRLGYVPSNSKSGSRYNKKISFVDI